MQVRRRTLMLAKKSTVVNEILYRNEIGTAMIRTSD
jgi:hypothetical protein